MGECFVVLPVFAPLFAPPEKVGQPRQTYPGLAAPSAETQAGAYHSPQTKDVDAWQLYRALLQPLDMLQVRPAIEAVTIANFHEAVMAVNRVLGGQGRGILYRAWPPAS